MSLFLLLAVSCSTMSDRTILSDAYYNLGNSELDKGNNQEAEKYYFTALSYNSDNRSVSYNLALTYTLNGQFAEAENLFQLLLAEDPDNVIILNASAWNMYKRGDPNKALELYESVLGNNPAFDELRKNCIRVYLEVENFDRASFHLDFLIENSTLNSDILFLQGELFFLQNNPEAEDWYIAAWEKDSGNNEAVSGLVKILHNKSAEKPIQELYEKLDSAELLDSELIYEFSLHLLTLGKLSGFTYLREAVLLGFDVSQVKKSDVSTLSDPIKKELLTLLGEEFIRKYQDAF
ncbi:MAG: tetratricopeptide repeat protein [Bacteroidetes bacterium]|nr:tetratricopeptide repeat protein [Bacteroidota bacterium]